MKDRNENSGRVEKDIESLIEMLHDIPESPVPGRFDFRLKQALKQEAEEREKERVKFRRRKRLWRRGSAVAAVFVVGVVSFAMLEDALKLNRGDIAESLAVKKGTQAADMAAPATNLENAKTGGADGVQGDPAAPDTEREDGTERYYRRGVQEEEASLSKRDDAKEKSGGPAGAGANGKPGAGPVAGAAGGTGGAMGSGSGGAGGASDLTASDSFSVQGESRKDNGASRGLGFFQTADEYNKACNQWIDAFAKALDTKDEKLLADTIAKGGVSGYTKDTAVTIFKLYSDYLGTGRFTYECIGCDTAELEKSLVIKGGDRRITVDIKTTSSGLEVSEPILDHGLWLSRQLAGTEYSLVDYEIQDGGNEILYRVTIKAPRKEDQSEDSMAAENSGAADSGGSPPGLGSGDSNEEVRGILWTKTE